MFETILIMFISMAVVALCGFIYIKKGNDISKHDKK